MADARADGANTEVRCEIDADARSISGQVTVRFTNRAAAPMERAYLWLLPNRMGRRPAGLSDVNHYWVYPKRFNPGDMALTSVAVGTGADAITLGGEAYRAESHAVAGRGALWSVALPWPVPAGGSVTLSLGYRSRIPERYGGFGCVDDRCTFIGGFYPMLAAHDAGGWDLEAPPMRGDIKVTVDVPRPSSVIIFDQWSGDGVFRAEGIATDVAYATVFVAPRWYESSRLANGVELRMLAASPPPPADDARDKVIPYTKENYTRYALETGGKAVALLGAVGQPPAPGSRITLVEAPLRQDLAMAQPGVVVMSDRWYRIWPARRFRKFHDRELVRAIIGQVSATRISSARLEAARDIDTAADIIGSYLADVFMLNEHKKSEFAGDILRPVSFVPIVDQLLYAPQTMFASAYFGGVVDDEVLRDRPDRFNHTRPRGKLYYEKLRDLLEPAALTRFVDLVIAGTVPYRQAAEAAYGGSLEWFFRQWTLPYPRVNYKLVGRTSVARADGQWDNAVTVAKEVAAADLAPVEPVEVQVILTNGKERLLRWDGAGRQETLAFQAEAPIRRVIIDPRGRLLETDLDGGDEHVLFDNRDKHELRFVYNSFGLFLNVTDLSALLAVDFTLARVHDPKNEVRFTAWRSESVRAGVFSEYRRSFGPALDPDTLMSRVALRSSLRRLNGEFFSNGMEGGRAATSLTLGAEARSDDREFFFEPMHVRALAVGADLTATRRDSVSMGPGADVLVSGIASVRYTNVWTPWAGHTLALNGGAHLAMGDLQDRSQLISSGGLTGLRGYAPAELFTRARLMVRAEYRHWFRHDLSWNMGHYNFVRGVGGALFADAALMSPCDSYDIGRSDALHASVGYGMRFAYDSFGTLPFLMRVDVAVPVVRHQRSCLDMGPKEFPPVMVYISFEPPF